VNRTYWNTFFAYCTIEVEMARTKSYPDLSVTALKPTIKDEKSDNSLIVKVALGDEAAFHELFSRHYSRTLEYAKRLIGNNLSLAEDINQAVWMRIAQSAGTYQGKGFRAWIMAITRNRVFSHFQSSAVKHELLGFESESFDDKLISASNIENELSTKGDLEAVFSAVDRLPDRMRIALVSWVSEEMSREELAEKLQITLPALKGLLHRARKRLNEILESKQDKI
jgi:RNA polymerase sigma-70 factor, ECF subfamily